MHDEAHRMEAGLNNQMIVDLQYQELSTVLYTHILMVKTKHVPVKMKNMHITCNTTEPKLIL